MTGTANSSDRRIVSRHRLSTRLWHWTNVVAFFCMVMSGLMIFNAHPRLYWGEFGANLDPAWFEIGNMNGHGFLRIGGWSVDTTGWLGVWTDGGGVERHKAFPYWATIPSYYSLADARIWHLFFAWVLSLGLLFYLVRSFWNRHAQHDLAPTRSELSPAHLWQDIKDHARLKFPTGEAALRYNILQKLAYGSVLFLFLPLIILTGLCLSPGTNAWAGWLVELFGGRQSARSLHFLAMWALLGFFVVHIAMVVLAGPINEIRSMITGRYAVKPDPLPQPETPHVDAAA